MKIPIDDSIEEKYESDVTEDPNSLFQCTIKFIAKVGHSLLRIKPSSLNMFSLGDEQSQMTISSKIILKNMTQNLPLEYEAEKNIFPQSPFNHRIAHSKVNDIYWHVAPDHGVLEGGESVEIDVSTCLMQFGFFQSTLQFKNLSNSKQVVSIPVTCFRGRGDIFWDGNITCDTFPTIELPDVYVLDLWSDEAPSLLKTDVSVENKVLSNPSTIKTELSTQSIQVKPLRERILDQPTSVAEETKNEIQEALVHEFKALDFAIKPNGFVECIENQEYVKNQPEVVNLHRVLKMHDSRIFVSNTSSESIKVAPLTDTCFHIVWDFYHPLSSDGQHETGKLEESQVETHLIDHSYFDSLRCLFRVCGLAVRLPPNCKLYGHVSVKQEVNYFACKTMESPEESESLNAQLSSDLNESDALEKDNMLNVDASQRQFLSEMKSRSHSSVQLDSKMMSRGKKKSQSGTLLLVKIPEAESPSVRTNIEGCMIASQMMGCMNYDCVLALRLNYNFVLPRIELPQKEIRIGSMGFFNSWKGKQFEIPIANKCDSDLGVMIGPLPFGMACLSHPVDVKSGCLLLWVPARKQVTCLMKAVLNVEEWLARESDSISFCIEVHNMAVEQDVHTLVVLGNVVSRVLAVSLSDQAFELQLPPIAIPGISDKPSEQWFSVSNKINKTLKMQLDLQTDPLIQELVNFTILNSLSNTPIEDSVLLSQGEKIDLLIQARPSPSVSLNEQHLSLLNNTVYLGTLNILAGDDPRAESMAHDSQQSMNMLVVDTVQITGTLTRSNMFSVSPEHLNTEMSIRKLPGQLEVDFSAVNNAQSNQWIGSLPNTVYFYLKNSSNLSARFRIRFKNENRRKSASSKSVDNSDISYPREKPTIDSDNEKTHGKENSIGAIDDISFCIEPQTSLHDGILSPREEAKVLLIPTDFFILFFK